MSVSIADIEQILDEADEVIDGEMNCHTPEYRAIDHLRTAMRNLLRVVERTSAVQDVN